MQENKIIVDELADIEAKEVAEEKEANLLAALAASGEGLVAGFRKFMHVGNGHISKHQMGKRGATHNHKPTFRSRQILPMTPAQYRHFHFGAKQKEG